METGYRIAKSLAGTPASNDVKLEARGIMNRYELIGKPFSLVMKSPDGTIIDLGARRARSTIAYIWSATQSPNSLLALNRLKAGPAPNNDWVYICVNSTQADFNTKKVMAPFSGQHYFMPPGGENSFFDALGNRVVPYAYVISEEGLLSAFGPVSEISQLLGSAKR